MKHLLLKGTFALLLFFLAIPVVAKVVTQQEALDFAIRFWNNQVQSRSISTLSLAWNSNHLHLNSRSSADDTPTFYVFTPEGQKGFLIISAEDVSVPVLGYSFQDSMPDAENLPPNFRDWLECMHHNIEKARAENATQTASVEQSWLQSRAGTPVVLLETASWGQGNPYNRQCPMDVAVRSITGCVATALAIIMRYYKWPKQGKGTTTAYTTSSKKIYVDARNLEHEYEWDNMLLKYTNNSYTNEQANAVSTLMADIATAMEADFTPEATGAWGNPSILYNHFDYHPAMCYVYKDDYNDEKWNQLIIEELLKSRPIYYSGRSDFGHAFVLDGYTTDGYFHVNWGWSGYCDGYFYLNGLNPEDSNFNNGQRAILNMIPYDGSKITGALKFYVSGMTTTDIKDFYPNQLFYVRAKVKNPTLIGLKVSLRLAVTDKTGNIKEWISEEEKYTFNSYEGVQFVFPCNITGEIAIGDRIRMFYKEEGAESEEWQLVTSEASSIPWEILIADEYTISETTSVAFNKENGILTVNFKDGVTATVSLNEEVLSTGVTYNSNNVEVNTQQLPEGIYTIHLEKGKEIKEFTFEVKPLN